ncbi:MAG: glycerol acyltransferase [Bacteroidetes bacterium]|nr:glycerol acyltransferase [Bacteroidota bacterium]
MIRAGHRPFFVWFFRLYTNVNMKLYFSRVIVEGDTELPRKESVLLIGNHFSWWDGFFALWLNERFWKLRFHVMMLEEQLSGRMFLSRIGAYSIKKSSRTVIDSLNYSSDMLSEKGNLVVIYPQGEIRSQYHRPAKFDRGIERIIRNARGRHTILFYVALVDWFSSKRPLLTLRLKRFDCDVAPGHSAIEQAYNEHLEASLALQIPREV